MGLDDDDEDNEDDEWRTLLERGWKKATADAEEAPAEPAAAEPAAAAEEATAAEEVEAAGEAAEEEAAADEALEEAAVAEAEAEGAEAEAEDSKAKALFGDFEISDEEDDGALEAEDVPVEAEAEEAEAEAEEAEAEAEAEEPAAAAPAAGPPAGKAPVAKRPPGAPGARPPVAKLAPIAKRPPGAGPAVAKVAVAKVAVAKVPQVRPFRPPLAFAQPGVRPQAARPGAPVAAGKGIGKAPGPVAPGPVVAKGAGKGKAGANPVVAAAVAAANARAKAAAAAGGKAAGGKADLKSVLSNAVAVANAKAAAARKAAAGAGADADADGEVEVDTSKDSAERTELMQKAHKMAIKALQHVPEAERKERLPRVRKAILQRLTMAKGGGKAGAEDAGGAAKLGAKPGFLARMRQGGQAKGGHAAEGKGGKAAGGKGAKGAGKGGAKGWEDGYEHGGGLKRKDSSQSNFGEKKKKAKYEEEAVEEPRVSSTDAEGRRYDFKHCVVNMANVGATFSKKVMNKKDGDRLFDWEGVRRCVRFLKCDRKLKVIGVIHENYRGPDNSSPRQVTMPDDIIRMCESIEETPRLTGKCHSSADDEMTIKCAYRRNCRFLDNDNYRDWLQQLRDPKMRTWLNSVQDLLQMRYYFDKGLGSFDVLEGNIPPHLLAEGKDVDKRELWTASRTEKK